MMHPIHPEPNSSLPEDDGTEQHQPAEEAEYQTVSGVTVEITDLEVDVVDTGEEEVLSSQADPQAYGIEPGDEGTPSVPLDPAPSQDGKQS